MSLRQGLERFLVLGCMVDLFLLETLNLIDQFYIHGVFVAESPLELVGVSLEFFIFGLSFL